MERNSKHVCVGDQEEFLREGLGEPWGAPVSSSPLLALSSSPWYFMQGWPPAGTWLASLPLVPQPQHFVCACARASVLKHRFIASSAICQTKPSLPYLLAFLSCFSAASLSVFLWLKPSILLVPPTKTRSLSLLEQPVCCTKTFLEVSLPSWTTRSPLLCSPSVIRQRAKDFTGMISSSESSYEVRTIMTPPLHTGQPRVKEMK